MYEWIELDGVRSDSLGNVVVMDYTPLYLPQRSREETTLPGRLTAITQKAWQRSPADIPITLAVTGANQAEVHRYFRETVLPWLYNASRLTLDDAPEHFHRGAVTQVQLVEDEDRWVRLQVTFRCNPPCRLRLLSGQTGWFPTDNTPIPLQLTDVNSTVSASLTAPGWLGPLTYKGLETAETYLAVTGTWQTLRLGDSLEVVTSADTETTLYLDSENSQIWTCEADGTEINMMGATTGELPEIGPGSTSLYVGGTGISVTVRLLVIERG